MLTLEDIIWHPKNEQERKEGLDAMFHRERKFPHIVPGMGVKFSNLLVQPAMEAGSIPTASTVALGLAAETKGIRDIANYSERVQAYYAANERALRALLEQRRDSVKTALFANCMVKVSDTPQLVKAIGQAGGVDGLFVGAGPPFEVAKILQEFPDIRLIVIVSRVKAARIILKNLFDRMNIPKSAVAALYVERADKGGGHNGADEADYNDPEKKEEFTPQYLHDGIREFLGKQKLDIPLIIGGDISYGEDIQAMYDIGFDGFAQGTRSLITRTPDPENPEIIHGAPEHILKEYYLNPAYHAVVSKTSPTRYESRHLDCVPDHASRTNAERWRRCVACVKDPDPQAKCAYLERETPYCFEDGLMEVHRGEPGIFFAGASIDTIRKDKLYHAEDKDGSLRIPTFPEMLRWIMDPKGGYYRPQQ